MTSEDNRSPTFTLQRVLRDATNGAVGAGIATTLLYPLLVAKVRLQAQKRREANEENEKDHCQITYSGFLDCLLKVPSSLLLLIVVLLLSTP